MLLRSADSVLSRQVIVTGRISDAITGRPLRALPVVTLVTRDNPPRGLGLVLRTLADGHYSFSGDPTMPLVEPGADLLLRLRVEAERYQALQDDFGVAAGDLGLGQVVRSVAGQTVSLPERTALPVVRDVALLPVAVHIAGRVVEAADPQVPIGGASVRVTAPAARGPVITNAAGFFTLVELPVAAEVTIEAAAAGFVTTTRTIVLDYALPVNQVTLALAV